MTADDDLSSAIRTRGILRKELAKYEAAASRKREELGDIEVKIQELQLQIAREKR